MLRLRKSNHLHILSCLVVFLVSNHLLRVVGAIKHHLGELLTNFLLEVLPSRHLALALTSHFLKRAVAVDAHSISNNHIVSISDHVWLCLTVDGTNV